MIRPLRLVVSASLLLASSSAATSRSNLRGHRRSLDAQPSPAGDGLFAVPEGESLAVEMAGAKEDGPDKMVSTRSAARWIDKEAEEGDKMVRH
jgi:hypothetical protein